MDVPPVAASAVPRRRTRAAGQAFLRLLLPLVAGGLAGIALILVGRGLWMLVTEPRGHCGGEGIAAQPCPAGTGAIPVIAWPFLFVGVPLAVGYAIRGRWISRGAMLAAGVAGVLSGQAVFGTVAGIALPTAWQVASGSSTVLSTVGTLQYGDSVIWVGTSKAVSYDAATGQRRWTLAMPRDSVACAVSNPGTAAVGLIGYGAGQPGEECDGVLAVDLGTGRRLWAAPLPGASDGATLLVAGGSGVIVGADGLSAVSARTGARRWAFSGARGCTIDQAAASQGAIAALFRCGTGIYVTDLDAATGQPAWTSGLPQADSGGDLDLLSADPVVVTDWVLPASTGTGPAHGGSKSAVAFSASGRPAAFPLGTGDLGLQLAGEEYNQPPVVTDGMLVGVAATGQASLSLAGYRLPDGHLQWQVSIPDDYVDAITAAGGEVYFTDQVIPALFAVSAGSGALRPLGSITGLYLGATPVTLYPVGRHYVLVNPDAADGIPVIASVTGQ